MKKTEKIRKRAKTNGNLKNEVEWENVWKIDKKIAKKLQDLTRILGNFTHSFQKLVPNR